MKLRYLRSSTIVYEGQIYDEFRDAVVQKEFKVTCQLKRYADLILPYENN